MQIGDAIAQAFDLHRAGQPARADAMLRDLLARFPDHPDALNCVGVIEQQRGQFESSASNLMRAIERSPTVSGYHCNLGNTLFLMGSFADAENAYARALQLQPKWPEVWNYLGHALLKMGRCGDASQAFGSAVALKPDFADAFNSLGNALKDQGRLDEALAAYRQAVQVAPQFADALSNALYTMHFHQGFTPEQILQANRQWAKHFANDISAAGPVEHDNERNLDRKLRIGYVSPDFRDHVVGHAMRMVLPNHDRRQFHIECFSDANPEDAITAELRRSADAWHPTAPLNHEQLVSFVRERRIDILIDLTMHMARNRLFVFARRPAAVQANFLAYPATSGLDAIDYRITDAFVDPPGETEAFNSETLLRLPGSFWCYPPPTDAPDVNDLPAQSAGCLTFGSLNNPCKVSSRTIELWARVLNEIPESRLILHTRSGHPRERDPLSRQLIERGVTPGRIELVGVLPRAEYLRTCHRIDIALDTLPYNGGVTSCDMMWMGVPVISLRGRTSVGRAGESLLCTLGLDELLAHDADQFVAIAASLVSDPHRLATLRSTLRGRMKSSSLTDGAAFTRGVESLYREMWRMRMV